VTSQTFDRAFILPAAGLGLVLGWSSTQSPLVTLVAAVASVLGVLVFLHAEVLLLVLVAALPWEGSLAWPSEQVSVVKVLGALLFAAWALRGLVNREPVRLHGALVPALVVGLTVLLALAVSPDPLAGALDATRYALFIAFFFLIIQMVRTRRDIQRIVAVVVLSGSLAALWGLYSFVVLDRDRAAGPISDPNDFAYLLACLLPLAAYLISVERAKRALWAACFVALAVGTLATLSRGAFVGLLALGAWGLATRRIPLTAVLGAVVAVASVAALAFAVWAPQIHDKLQSKEQIASSNVDSRRAFWSGAVRMWADRPITGVGPGRFGAEAPAYVRNDPLAIGDPLVHNSYLQALAETGALGFAAFLAFLATTWQLLARARARTRAQRDAAGGRLVTAMHASMVIAAVSACFLSVELTTPFWLIGALAVAVACAPVPEGLRERAAAPA
jgi:putative inorganic carbon (HCO3(-)) transporter